MPVHKEAKPKENLLEGRRIFEPFTFVWFNLMVCLSKGSYTDTIGLGIIREDVAQFISRRDGYTADPDDVILTGGGAQGIRVRETDLVGV